MKLDTYLEHLYMFIASFFHILLKRFTICLFGQEHMSPGDKTAIRALGLFILTRLFYFMSRSSSISNSGLLPNDFGITSAKRPFENG